MVNNAPESMFSQNPEENSLGNSIEESGIDPVELLEKQQEYLQKALRKNVPRMLYPLWQNGVKSSHPYLSELFRDFEKGYIPG